MLTRLSPVSFSAVRIIRKPVNGLRHRRCCFCIDTAGCQGKNTQRTGHPGSWHLAWPLNPPLPPAPVHCPFGYSFVFFFFLSHFGVLGGAINRKRFPFVTHWIYRASPRSPPLRMGFLFYSLERALAKKNVGLAWLSAAFWPHCFKSVREGGHNNRPVGRGITLMAVLLTFVSSGKCPAIGLIAIVLPPSLSYRSTWLLLFFYFVLSRLGYRFRRFSNQPLSQKRKSSLFVKWAQSAPNGSDFALCCYPPYKFSGFSAILRKTNNPLHELSSINNNWEIFFEGTSK